MFQINKNEQTKNKYFFFASSAIRTFKIKYPSKLASIAIDVVADGKDLNEAVRNV